MNFDPENTMENTTPNAAQAAFKYDLSAVLSEVQDLLVSKNRKYGNAALEPVQLFSKMSAVDYIKVRIDDKLSRIGTHSLDEDEDVETDLLGYLLLLKIARKRAQRPSERT